MWHASEGQICAFNLQVSSRLFSRPSLSLRPGVPQSGGEVLNVHDIFKKKKRREGKRERGWRNSSAVKHTHCFARGPDTGPSSHTTITSALERPGASSKAPAPACAYPATYTLKINFLKIISKCQCAEGCVNHCLTSY